MATFRMILVLSLLAMALAMPAKEQVDTDVEAGQKDLQHISSEIVDPSVDKLIDELFAKHESFEEDIENMEDNEVSGMRQKRQARRRFRCVRVRSRRRVVVVCRKL